MFTPGDQGLGLFGAPWLDPPKPMGTPTHIPTHVLLTPSK